MKRWIAVLLVLIMLVPWIPVRVDAEDVTILASGTISKSSSDAVGWYIDSNYNLFIYGAGETETFSYKAWKSYLSQIVSVTVGSGVTILNYAFQGMGEQCVSWSFPDTLVKFGSSCFDSCSFSSFTIPGSVTTLGDWCFNACVNLTSISIPGSVTNISSYVFDDCTSLTDVYFVSTVPPASIGTGVFRGCPVGLQIHVPAGTYDAYCAAMPEYAAFIVADGSSSGDGGTDVGGGVYDPENDYFYTLNVWHDQQDAYYLDSDVQFYASLMGGDVDTDRSVTWSVIGADPSTSISSTGLLHIGSDEWYSSLTVVATSVAYPSLSSSSTIIITKSADPGVDDDSGDCGCSDNVTHDDLMLMATDTLAYIGTLQVSVDAANAAIAELQTSGGSADLSEVTEAVGDVQSSVDEMADTMETLPNQIQDSMEQIQEQEKVEYESQGNQSVDGIIELIPDESAGFLDSLGTLVQALSYDGTDAILTMPAITIPGIDGLFPSFTVLEEQDINFKDYFDMMPSQIMSIIVAMFDIAVVLFCLKEFLGLVSALFSGDFDSVFTGGKTAINKANE